MNRYVLRKTFKAVGPAVLPVIHTLDAAQAKRNILCAMTQGAHGVFLINHDFPHDDLVPILKDVRAEFPWVWIGANFLGVSLHTALPILADLESSRVPIDGYWADDACIDERKQIQHAANTIDAAREGYRWSGIYFGGVAFKKQRPVDAADFQTAAKIACRHMDVVTTSGAATGVAADLSKIETFRVACEDTALAIASGITLDNVSDYARMVDAILVATGINYDGDFYNIDPAKLHALLERVRTTAIGDLTP